ncbi:hypothetical protein HanIR_Chr06g0279121 [Helianthus annuus]|nr:hypothetical protein HanIR_Chr06g0279121 [Helianthus annuus]
MVLGRSYCKLTDSQITHNKKIQLCTYFHYLFPNTSNFDVSRTLLWLNQWHSSDTTFCHSPRSQIPGNGRPRASFGGITLFIQFGSGNFHQDRS